MESHARPDAGPAPAPDTSLLRRVALVLVAPTTLGERIAEVRENAPWFWTLALVALVSAAVFVVLPTELWRDMVQQQVAAAGQGESPMDPETMMRFARFGGAGGALIMTFVGALFIAAVMYLAFNVMFGADTTFRQHLSAASHIYWINMIGLLIVVPIWIARGSIEITLSLGLLLPEAPETYVGHLLNSITIFGVWSASALGAVESGLSRARISVGKGAATVLALYLVWALINAARATVFGM